MRKQGRSADSKQRFTLLNWGGINLAEKKESGKKQIVLRLSPTLWTDLAAWAEDDFRSINGQIEFLLTECVKKRKKGKNKED